MSFNPNIPTTGNPILQSFFQLRANFQQIANAFASNHTRLNGTGGDPGNHTVLTMRPQSGDPATSSNQIALYNKLVSSVPQLFYRPNNSQDPIQLTYQSLKVDESDTQYTFIAGPFIVYGGFLSKITVGQVVNLTPGSSLFYVGLLAANVSDPFYRPNRPDAPAIADPIPENISGTSFTIYNEAFTGFMDVYYLAIGI